MHCRAVPSKSCLGSLKWHAAHAICASGLALELKWNVLNSAFVLPCLRGARLAETKDRFRLGAFRVDVSPCLQRPRGRVGEALRAIQFNIWGDPNAGVTGVLVTQIGTNEWIGSSARFADWMVARTPRPSCQALRACTPAGLSFWELQRKERFKIHAPPPGKPGL